jgi:aspartyl-tRNA(Asn)/glutamyl-tRNA(Gln) amidotransferase subunit B
MAGIPELPEQKALRFMKQYGLKEYDAKVLVGDKLVSEIFEDCAKIDVKIATKIISRELLGILNYNSLQLSSTKITSSGVAGLVRLIASGKVSEKNAKESLIKYALEGIEPEHYLSSNNLLMDSSAVDIAFAVKSVIEENQSAFSDFKAGSSKALNFLIGAVMKKLRGKADARIVQKEIEKLK